MNFFKNNSSVILLINPKSGIIVDLNPAASQFYGYAREAIVNKPITLLNPLPMSELLKAMDASISGASNHFFFQHRLASGELRDVEIYSGSVEVSGKELIYSIVHDITKRRKAEQAVWERKQFLAAILQTVAEGFWVLDMHNIITEVNDAYCSMTGYNREELIDMPLDSIEVYSANGHQRIFQIQANGSELYETEHRRKDGSHLPLEISSTFLPEMGGQVVNFCRDLTERKLAEETLRTTLERMQIILSNLQLGLLLINHDNKVEFINQTCCDLFGFTEPPAQLVGTSATELVSRATETTVDPQSAALRIQELISNNVLVLNEEIQMDPAPLVKEVVKLLRSTIPSTIRIETQIQQSPPFICADPVQLQQVVMNLCTNAAHAMEQTGGTVTLRLQSVTLQAEDLLFHPYIHPGSFVQLTVADSGPGISQEIQEKMFEAYFTTKEVGKGTGMGLAIVHDIVTNAGGLITYDGTPGKGAVFSCLFSGSRWGCSPRNFGRDRNPGRTWPYPLCRRRRDSGRDGARHARTARLHREHQHQQP